MDSFVEKCERPIPIGVQKFAYQCENISIEPIRGAVSIRAFIPHRGGYHPYPNAEKDAIQHYDLKIERFTGNAMEVLFTKKFKDGSEKLYLTNLSFSDLVNRIFHQFPANIFDHETPYNNYPNESKQ